MNVFAQDPISQIEGYLEVYHHQDNSSLYIGKNAGGEFIGGSGFTNTFVGTDAGQENFNGHSNSFFGNYTGAKLTSGYKNSFFGRRAGAFNITGSNNSSFGFEAGLRIEGDSCIAIGNRAGPTFSGARKSQNQRLFIDVKQSNDPLIYGEFDNELVRVNGNFEVNKSSDNSKILVVDNASRDLTIWSGKLGIGVVPSADSHKLNVNGTAAKSTSGGWIFNSDARLKKDITSLNSYDILQKVLAMQGVYYKWNDPREDFVRHTGTEIGFLAQDLQKIWPEKISLDADGYLQTSYEDFDPMFVEAIKGQQEIILAMSKDIKLLKGENVELKEENMIFLRRLKALEQLIKDKLK